MPCARWAVHDFGLSTAFYLLHIDLYIYQKEARLLGMYIQNTTECDVRLVSLDALEYISSIPIYSLPQCPVSHFLFLICVAIGLLSCLLEAINTAISSLIVSSRLEPQYLLHLHPIYYHTSKKCPLLDWTSPKHRQACHRRARPISLTHTVAARSTL